MKSLTFFIAVFLLPVACKHTTAMPVNQPDSSDSTLSYMSVFESIKEHYFMIYGQEGRFEEFSDSTAIRLTCYNIPNEDEENEGVIVTITIPLTGEKELYGAIPVLMGDLNKDKKEDLLITAHNEFGNSASQDIFIFINEGDNYSLASVTDNRDLMDCRGYFRARKIVNNYIEGNSSCYSSDDAECCPSLHYETKLVFSDDSLRLVSKRIRNLHLPEKD